MADYVLKPNDLDHGGIFQILYQARTTLPLKELDFGVFFNSCIDRFHVGDRVEICVYADHQWARLLEMRECRVVDQTGPRGSSGRKLMFEWVGEGHVFGQGERKASQPAADTKPQYKVVAEFGAGFNVVDDKGHVYEKFEKKADADAHAKSLNGGKEPEKKAPAKPKGDGGSAGKQAEHGSSLPPTA